MLLKVTYEDRTGKADSSESFVELNGEAPEYFENRGIRKGVVLARYADLLKNWLIDEREHTDISETWEPRVDDWSGIVVPPALGKWERQSLPLTVSEPYRELFGEFTGYFKQEIEALDDSALEQELEILAKLGKG